MKLPYDIIVSHSLHVFIEKERESSTKAKERISHSVLPSECWHHSGPTAAKPVEWSRRNS